MNQPQMFRQATHAVRHRGQWYWGGEWQPEVTHDDHIWSIADKDGKRLQVVWRWSASPIPQAELGDVLNHVKFEQDLQVVNDEGKATVAIRLLNPVEILA